MRLGILETPVFARLLKERGIQHAPVAEVFRRNRLQIALTALCRMAEQAPFYVFTAFVFAYGAERLNLSRNVLIAAVLIAATVSFISIPSFGHLSDRIGRKKVYMLGAALTGAYGFAYLRLLDTRTPLLVVLAIIVSLIPHDMLYGPQAALIAESFPASLRYSGASLGYQFSSVIAGGPAPLISAWLLSTYHSGGIIAVYILFCSTVTLIATALLKDYTNKDISVE